MNCRSARKHIPGFANGTLADETKHDLERHLGKCEACRTDADAFRDGIEAMKTPGAFGEMDFTEAEWTAAIRAAVTSRRTEKSDRFVPAFRPAFGYALGVLLVGAAILFGVRRFPWLVPIVDNHPDSSETVISKSAISNVEAVGKGLWARGKGAFAPKSRPSPDPAQAPPQPAGDVPSFTWISEETGLQIVWFVNDNLKLEE